MFTNRCQPPRRKAIPLLKICRIVRLSSGASQLMPATVVCCRRFRRGTAQQPCILNHGRDLDCQPDLRHSTRTRIFNRFITCRELVMSEGLRPDHLRARDIEPADALRQPAIVALGAGGRGLKPFGREELLEQPRDGAGNGGVGVEACQLPVQLPREARGGTGLLPPCLGSRERGDHVHPDTASSCRCL